VVVADGSGACITDAEFLVLLPPCRHSPRLAPSLVIGGQPIPQALLCLYLGPGDSLAYSTDLALERWRANTHEYPSDLFQASGTPLGPRLTTRRARGTELATGVFPRVITRQRARPRQEHAAFALDRATNLRSSVLPSSPKTTTHQMPPRGRTARLANPRLPFAETPHIPGLGLPIIKRLPLIIRGWPPHHQEAPPFYPRLATSMFAFGPPPSGNTPTPQARLCIYRATRATAAKKALSRAANAAKAAQSLLATKNRPRLLYAAEYPDPASFCINPCP
jgi:hypothetical protein